MLEYVKVKVVSLADEIARIHREEGRVKKRYRWNKNKQGYEVKHARDVTCFWGLRDHRLHLRTEARAAQLAYGYLRGRKYRVVECNSTEKWWNIGTEKYPAYHPTFRRTVRLVEKYGEDLFATYEDAEKALLSWINE